MTENKTELKLNSKQNKSGIRGLFKQGGTTLSVDTKHKYGYSELSKDAIVNMKRRDLIILKQQKEIISLEEQLILSKNQVITLKHNEAK